LANDSLDFVQRGKVSIVRRQYAEAVKICRLGLLGQPSLLEGRLVLGMALTALGRWDEVLAEMRVALETDPNSALAWLLKGEALVGKGDLLQAEATLKRAKELDPSNTKADQLLQEIATARAAGFEGLPAEPTDTKVYPARAQGGTDPDLGQVVKPMPMDRGELVRVPDDGDDHGLDYEEATQVDPNPSGRLALGKKPDKPASVLVDFGDGDDTVDDSQVSTETFAAGPPTVKQDHSLPGATPAAALSAEESEERSTMTPSDVLRARMPSLAGGRRRASDELTAPEVPESSEPSIVLDSGDIVREQSSEGFPRGFAPTFETDEDDELTRQRRQRQVDEHAGTATEVPGEVALRQRPRSLEAVPRPQPTFPVNSSEAPTELRDSGSGYGVGDGRRVYDNNGEDSPPGVVRVPVSKPIPRQTLYVRGDDVPWYDRGRRGIALLLTALVAVIAVGVVTGLLVREWRMRARVTKRHELARQKLASGNYPGYQAAELLYRQILTERDDPEARALRARVLAQMAFEFGDSPEPALRALSTLGDDAATPCADKRPGCQDAAQARVYTAMARGELDRAQRLALSLRRNFPDAISSYVVGRAELLLERPEAAIDALRAAVETESHNPLLLHGLGLAEASARHDDRALAAYRKALEANANHIATIIDRALLQVSRGGAADRELARGALAGVVGKLVGDSSPGQLARAFLGLAQLDLGKGDMEAARRDLNQAAARRRDGDALLSEELAQAFAQAYMLDEAEREAKRAIAAAGRLTPRLTLAEVALRRARPQQALAVIEEAGTSRPEALVMRALASLMLGRKESARLDAEAALRVAPDLVPAKVALARVDIADGRPERAQRALDALERTSQKTPEVAAALGMVYVAEKVPDRARWWFKEALKREPLDVEARLALARLYHDAGQFDQAREELKQVLATNAAYAPARRELALLALDAGDAVAARDELDALMATDDSVDLDTMLTAVKAHLLLGDGPGAEERIARAQRLASAPQAAEELIGLSGRALIVEHRPLDAALLLRKAVPSATRGETVATLMEAYLDLDEPDHAFEVINLAPLRARTGLELTVARARLAVERGRDSVAEGFAQEALARLKGPRAPRALKAEAYTVLGRAEHDQGKLKAAMRSLKTATDLDPRSARAWYHLGLVADEAQQAPVARAAFESAAKADPQLADAYYHLGRLRAVAQDPSAIEAYQKYLEVAPKGIYAVEVRQALKDGPLNQPPPPLATPTNSRPQKRRRAR
jgi:tetratricopeptide (TPR) repeat protein